MSERDDKTSRFGRLEVGAEAVRKPAARAEAGVITVEDHLRRGQGLEAQGRYEEALQAYSRALRQNAHGEAAWVGQLRCLIEMGDFSEALTWSMRALEYLPQSGDILSLRCIALAREGRGRDAMELSDRIVEAGPAGPLAWIARAWAQGEDRFESAERCISKALEMPDEQMSVSMDAALFYLEHKRFGAALRLLQEVSRARPALAQGWYLQAICLENLGDTDEALAAARHALQIAPHATLYRDAVARLGGAGGLTSFLHRLFRR